MESGVSWNIHLLSSLAKFLLDENLDSIILSCLYAIPLKFLQTPYEPHSKNLFITPGLHCFTRPRSYLTIKVHLRDKNTLALSARVLGLNVPRQKLPKRGWNQMSKVVKTGQLTVTAQKTSYCFLRICAQWLKKPCNDDFIATTKSSFLYHNTSSL